MTYKASINIMPHKELLDPQGKAAAKSLRDIDVVGVTDLRIGKHVELTIEAADEDAAHTQIKQACDKLLSNPIMEYYTYELSSVDAG